MAKHICLAFPIGLLGLFLAAAIGADAAQKPDEKTLSATYDEVAKMFDKNDVAALRKAFADDFVLIDHEGKTNKGADFLKAMTNGVVAFRSFDYGAPQIKEIGDAGVLQGSLQLSMTYGRVKPVDITGRFAATTVFVKRDGQWRLTAAQLTAVKPQGAQ